ncbi:hypothetical protein H4217_003079 [Coemansia sp. RSA 1939]|nr:hypothetical protein H4217_003079 [Coemansia sp. RSA 1939]KAJ2616744.1 hypothetical protein EV177_000908 [Coemansia sp. RSA 1804]
MTYEMLTFDAKVNISYHQFVKSNYYDRVPQPAPDDSAFSSGTSMPHKRWPASEPADRAPKRPCANSNGSSAPARPAPQCGGGDGDGSSAHTNLNNELLRGCYRYRRQA